MPRIPWAPLAAGTAATPFVTAGLHIAGDEYGVALALIAAAAWANQRTGGHPATKAALTAAVLALATNLTALGDLTVWTTGAPS